MESTPIDTKTLSHFAPLEALSQEQLHFLASIVELKTVPAGTRIIEKGSNEDCSFFLVKGQLQLTASDGKSRLMDATDPGARAPIAQLRPRMYDVKANTTAEFIKIDSHLLLDIHNTTVDDDSTMTGYTVSEAAESHPSHEFAEQLTNHLMADLENDELKLPSLPDVAIRVGKALKDEVSDADKIAAIIQSDPVITAKLIKASNGAIYGRRVPVETVAGAVIRLGSDVTHKLVVSYAMKELFQTKSPMLKQRMKSLWSHSTKVAAICFVLAKMDKRFEAEHALLIGLLHDIGTVPILNYASTYGEQGNDSEVVDKIIQQLKGQIGTLILTKWGFSNELVVAAAEGEKWSRDTGGPPDYCDLLITAQLHSFIGTPEAHDAPPLDQVPAPKRLGLEELSPRMSLKILDRAKKQIANAETLLNI